MSSTDAQVGKVDNVGMVAIGRNEGERLKVCLRSLIAQSDRVIYVDSGSSDDSVSFAKSIGVEVVNLDTSIQFTAARARNEGIARLIELHPDTAMVQVVDGDCELQPGWIETARAFLEANPSAAITCGRTRERHPEHSIYNQLCDLEWDTPIGEAKSCGGIAMIRLNMFNEVGGYNPGLIAGEEPELCVRLRAKGYSIHRLDHEMVLHDAAMTRLSQYWKRAKRAGHAYAQGADLHGLPPERYGVKQVRSAILWGLVFPLVALILAWWTFGLSVIIYLLLVGVQCWRISKGQRRRGRSSEHAWLIARFIMLAKHPQASGVLLYWRRKLLKKQSVLIEYKEPSVQHTTREGADVNA